MGKNKHIRNLIQGELNVIQEHLDKIRTELNTPYPDQQLLSKWEKDIARHQRILTTLRTKLPGGKK